MGWPTIKHSSRNLAAQLAHYTVNARARNFSPKTLAKIQLGLKLLDDFMGSIPDVRQVTGDDLRRFILALQQRTRWQGTIQASRQRLTDETTRTYAQAVKVLWGWLLKKGTVTRNPLEGRSPHPFPDPRRISSPD